MSRGPSPAPTAPRSASSPPSARAPCCSTRSTRWAWSSNAILLRVIETGEFEPVGSIETQKCHARLIVASNIDLDEAVESGRFRPDLYFRLNVMYFHLPPLRERTQDIALLARAMAARFNRKFRKTCSTSPGHAGRPGELPLAGQHSPAGKRHSACRPGQHRPGTAAAASARSAAGHARGREESASGNGAALRCTISAI